MAKQTLPVSAEDSLSINQVGGDLTVDGWDRQELQASGDVLHVERDGRSLAVTSGGDLSMSVPRGMSISLRTIGGDVTMQNLSGVLELGLIGGDANLRNLSGRVQLNGAIGGETHMENVANVSVNSAARGPGSDFGDQFGERIRRQIQHATERADRKIKRAQAKMYKAQFDSGRWKYNSGSDAASPAPSGDPVSDEERMAILRMLQEKKITAEEAEKLLAALEGGA